MSYNKETGMYEGYIYKIYNDVNDKVYIGQTIKTVKERWWQHKTASKDVRKVYYIYSAIRKYGIEKFHIKQIEKICCFSKDELQKALNILEEKWILHYDSYHNGYNETPGGSLALYSSETKTIPIDVYDLSGQLMYQFDSIISASDKLGIGASNISACCRGVVRKAQKYIFRYRNEPFNKYPIDTKLYKKVYQFSTSQELIITYESKSDAIRANNLSKHFLEEAIKYGTLYKGYFWNNKNEFPLKIKKGKSKNIVIDQYSIDGKFLNTYNSSAEASLLVFGDKKYQASIRKCCNGQLSAYKNYIWRIHGEPFDKYNSRFATTGITISVFDEEMNLINTYNSIGQAQLELHISFEKIKKILNTGIVYKNIILCSENY